MKNINLALIFSRLFLFLVLSSFFNVLSAQQTQTTSNFEPYSGQAGKDVVWVPTPQALVDKMLEIAKVTPNDFLIDLGSGDGRTVITAAKKGLKARGIEFNPDMVALSKRNAVTAGVSEKTEFVQGDLFEADLSQASVITMFLLPEINLRLRPFILNLKPGTRIVSNTFTMGEWQADETLKAGDDCDSWCDALLWIVPAKVNGIWNTPQGELQLDQEFQMITGTMKNGNRTMKISNGKLTGNQITFMVNEQKFMGTVNGNSMEGIVESGQNNMKWNALLTIK